MVWNRKAARFLLHDILTPSNCSDILYGAYTYIYIRGIKSCFWHFCWKHFANMLLTLTRIDGSMQQDMLWKAYTSNHIPIYILLYPSAGSVVRLLGTTFWVTYTCAVFYNLSTVIPTLSCCGYWHYHSYISHKCFFKALVCVTFGCTIRLEDGVLASFFQPAKASQHTIRH